VELKFVPEGFAQIIRALSQRNYSAAENYRNITLRAVMIFYSPIGSRDSKIS
jgi:hypothetical protein